MKKYTIADLFKPAFQRPGFLNNCIFQLAYLSVSLAVIGHISTVNAKTICYYTSHKIKVKCDSHDDHDCENGYRWVNDDRFPAVKNCIDDGSGLDPHIASIVDNLSLSEGIDSTLAELSEAPTDSTPNGSPIYETDCPVDIQSRNKRMHSIDYMGGGDFPLYVKRDYYSELMSENESDFYAIWGEDWVSNFDHWLHRAPMNPNRSRPRSKKIKTVGNKTYYRNSATGITRVMETASQEKDSYGKWRSRLHKEINRQGVSKTYYYNGPRGKLSQVLHSSGESLQFHYTGNRLSEITVPGGDKIEYKYLGTGKKQLLTEVHLPSGGYINYNYELTTKTYGEEWWYLAGSGFDGKQRAQYTFGFDITGLEKPWKVRTSGLIDGTNKSEFKSRERMVDVVNAKGGVENYNYRYPDSGHTLIARAATSHADASKNTIQLMNHPQLTDVDKDGRGTEKRTRYNKFGEIKRMYLDGVTTQYTYDDQGRLTTISRYKADNDYLNNDPEEQNLPLLTKKQYKYYPYDSAGRGLVELITKTDQVGNASVVKYTYRFHSNNLLKQKIVDGPLSGDGDAITYNYDSKGRLKSVVDSRGLTHSYTYNGKHFYKADTHNDPNGLVTKFKHSPNGHLIEVRIKTSPEQVWKYGYNTDGSLSYKTTPSGQRTNYRYDREGLLREEILYEGGSPFVNQRDARELYERSLNGEIIYGEELNYLQHSFVYKYDKLGNVTNRQVKNEKVYIEDVQEPEADSWGDPIGDIFVDLINLPEYGAQWGYTYDEYGNLTTERRANGGKQTYYYDANGNIKEIKDGLNRKTVMTYSPQDELETITQNGETVTHKYDLLGRIASIEDAENNLTEYNNLNSREVVLNSPDSGTTTLSYDVAGNLTSLARDNGASFTNHYDESGRLESVTSSGADVAQGFKYTYGDETNACDNAKGQICRIESQHTSALSEEFDYTKDGKIAGYTLKHDSLTLNLKQQYDSAGRLYIVEYPQGDRLRYTYNKFNEVTNLDFSPKGQLNSWRRLVSTSSTDKPATATDHRRIGLNNFYYDKIRSNRLRKVNDSIIGYDAAGQIKSLSKYNQTFGYDDSSRLTSFSSSELGSKTWEYDNNGNRTRGTRGRFRESYNVEAGTNRIRSISGATTFYHYDDAGNRTSDHLHNDANKREYYYDAFNRLVKVRLDKSNAKTVEFKYDSAGHRVYKKAPNGKVTYYLYNVDGTLAAEITKSGSSAVIGTLYAYIEGVLVLIKRGGKTYSVIVDHLGRPEIVKDGNKVVWEAENLPFTRKVVKDTFGGLNIGLPGQYYDEDIRLWNNWHRYYDARIGTYTQSDPIGLAGGMNTYAYVGNNPISYVDPTGLAKDTVTARIEALAARGDIRSLQNLRGGQGLNPTQDALAKQLIGRLNKINHVFGKSQHKLDGFVKSCGNQGKAFDKLNDAFGNAVKGRGNGPIELDVSVNGFNITVRGAVVDGSPKLGTAFIP